MKKGCLYWLTERVWGHTIGIYDCIDGHAGPALFTVSKDNNIPYHHCTGCWDGNYWTAMPPSIVEGKFWSRPEQQKYQQLPQARSLCKSYKKNQRVLVYWAHYWTRCDYGTIMVECGSSGEYSVQLDQGNLHVFNANCIWPENVMELRENCKRTLLCWLWATEKRHKRLYRDIRTLIGRYIWNTRDDSEWAIHRCHGSKRAARKMINYGE